MESDFWTTRLAAVKRQFRMQNNNPLSRTHSQLDRFNIYEIEADEEVRPDYLCPYCYEEFDMGSFCSHIEDEHSCESKATVCPICSVKIAGDMLSHIKLQHGHLFKRHRRLRRVPIPSSQALSLLGRDLREAHLQMLLGGGGHRSNSAASSPAVTDDFLSSLVLRLSAFDADEISNSLMSSLEENSAKSVASRQMWKSSFFSSLSHEEREEGLKQAAARAVFVQDLLVSTLVADH